MNHKNNVTPTEFDNNEFLRLSWKIYPTQKQIYRQSGPISTTLREKRLSFVSDFADPVKMNLHVVLFSGNQSISNPLMDILILSISNNQQRLLR